MRKAVSLRGVSLDAIRTHYNSGKMRVYSGTRPTNADTALSGNTLHFTLPAFATIPGKDALGEIDGDFP